MFVSWFVRVCPFRFLYLRRHRDVRDTVRESHLGWFTRPPPRNVISSAAQSFGKTIMLRVLLVLIFALATSAFTLGPIGLAGRTVSVRMDETKSSPEKLAADKAKYEANKVRLPTSCSHRTPPCGSLLHEACAFPAHGLVHPTSTARLPPPAVAHMLKLQGGGGGFAVAFPFRAKEPP